MTVANRAEKSAKKRMAELKAEKRKIERRAKARANRL